MEIAMEKWKAPGVSIRLIEEGKAEGTYEVTIEKKKTATENEKVEGEPIKTGEELEPEVAGGKEENKTSKADAPMDICMEGEMEETKGEQYQGKEEQVNKQGMKEETETEGEQYQEKKELVDKQEVESPK